MNSELRSLYTFTLLLLEDARRLARHGHKDEAHKLLRFVDNSSIPQLLKRYKSPDPAFDIDVPRLEWQMRELAVECHPQSVPVYRDDFTAIRGQLNTLAAGVASLLNQNAAQTKP